MSMLNRSYKQYPHETAAYWQAEEEHAEGVTPFMGSDYKTHYRRSDGSIVPGFDWFLRKVYEGYSVHHKPTC